MINTTSLLSLNLEDILKLNCKQHTAIVFTLWTVSAFRRLTAHKGIPKYTWPGKPLKTKQKNSKHKKSYKIYNLLSELLFLHQFTSNNCAGVAILLTTKATSRNFKPCTILWATKVNKY